MKKLLLLLLFPLAGWSQPTDANLKSVQIDPKIRNITTASGITKGNVSDVLEAMVNGKVSRIEANSTSGTNTYTATISWLTSYSFGLNFPIVFNNGNTGASTININTLGPIALKKNGSSALVSGDLAAGQVFWLFYDGINFQVIGIGGGTSSGVKYGTTSGTNTYTSTISGVSSYTTGDTYTVKFGTSNSSAITLDINGLGAKSVISNGLSLSGGEIDVNQIYVLTYDGTNFQISGSPLAGGAVPGVMYLFNTTGNSTIGTMDQNSITNAINSINTYTDAESGAIISSVYGLTKLLSVKAMTTTSLPSNSYSSGVITASSFGSLPSIDGISLNNNDYLIVNNESSPSHNGVYVVTNSGSVFTSFVLTRRSDANTALSLTNSFAYVQLGSTNKEKFFYQTNYISLLGTTSVKYAQIVTPPLRIIDEQSSNYGSNLLGEFVPFDLTGNTWSLTLPNAPPDGTMAGAKIVKIASTNTLIVNANGSDVFEKVGGAASKTLSTLNQSQIYKYKASIGVWYTIAESTPNATSSNSGVVKLYPTTGGNTDGAMDQNSVTTALSGKQAALVSGTNIKTINSTSLLGSGDITISGGGSSLTPTAVKTSNYTAAVGDLVKCDVTTGFTVTLPPAPADKSEILVKIVAPATVTNTLTIAAGGSDVFNIASGSTSLSLTQKFQSVWLQYQSTGAIWIIKTTDAAGLATKVNQGTTYTQVGTLLDELFPGTTLNATNWSGSLPTGATINNKLIIASGVNDWTSRVLQLQKFYPFEKQEFNIYFKAVTKNSGDAWGITQNPSLLLLYNAPIYIKFDQGTGAASGMLSMGTTTAANEYGYSQPLTFNSGDQLRLRIIKQPGTTLIELYNITTPSNPIAFGKFPVDIRMTGGQYRLAFLGGQQEFTEFKVTSQCRNYGGTGGAVFIGDSSDSGAGASDIAFRWIDRMLGGQNHLYEVLGMNSWLSGTLTSGRVTEFLTGINGKYLFISYGYNDFAQSVAGATYQANLQTIATTAQGLGYTVFIISITPSFTVDNSSFDAFTSAAATAVGATYINVRTPLLGSGTTLNPNLSSSDQIHLGDAGHLVKANTVKASIASVYDLILTDLDNTDIKIYNPPLCKASTALAAFAPNGTLVKVDAADYKNQNYPILQSTLTGQNSGAIGIDGKLLIGDVFQQKNATAQGLLIGSNNGLNDAACSNAIFTNVGTGGAGAPQAFPNVTGARNFIATFVTVKGSYAAPVSGNDNVLIQAASLSAGISGNGNTVINNGVAITALTSGGANIGIGSSALRAITTGSNNLHLITKNTGGSSFPVGLSSTLIFGEMSTAEAFTTNDVSFSNGQYATTFNMWLGGRENQLASTITLNAAAASGTNVAGNPFNIRASSASGNAVSGGINFQTSIAGSSGTTLQRTYTTVLGLTTTLANFGVTIKPVAGTTTLAPMQFTAAASLLTTPLALAVEPSVNGDYLNLTTTTGTIRRVIVAGSSGRATAQTALNNSVATYTLGATDASYEVSANVLVTTSSAENFTVTVSYTDEGNTARVLTLNFQTLGAVIGTAINFANGAVPYEGLVAHIRCKASTSITVKTTGTFTGATYNVEGIIKQTN